MPADVGPQAIASGARTEANAASIARLPVLGSPGSLTVLEDADGASRLTFRQALDSMWCRQLIRPPQKLYVTTEGEGGMDACLEAQKATLGGSGKSCAMNPQPATVGPPALQLSDIIGAYRQQRGACEGPSNDH